MKSWRMLEGRKPIHSLMGSQGTIRLRLCQRIAVRPPSQWGGVFPIHGDAILTEEFIGDLLKGSNYIF